MTVQVEASDYERAVVHPMTAYWLTANGYSYRHEVSLWASFYHRCAMLDFLAWREGEGRYLIIECKVMDVTVPDGIHQLDQYAMRLEAPSERMIVVPRGIIREYSKAQIAKRGVHLLALPMPIAKSAYDRYRNVNYGSVPKSYGEPCLLPSSCYHPAKGVQP